jgi:hypothetical protein
MPSLEKVRDRRNNRSVQSSSFGVQVLRIAWPLIVLAAVVFMARRGLIRPQLPEYGVLTGRLAELVRLARPSMFKTPLAVGAPVFLASLAIDHVPGVGLNIYSFIYPSFLFLMFYVPTLLVECLLNESKPSLYVRVAARIAVIIGNVVGAFLGVFFGALSLYGGFIMMFLMWALFLTVIGGGIFGFLMGIRSATGSLRHPGS